MVGLFFQLLDLEVAKYEDRSVPEDFKTMRQILMDVGELLSFVCIEPMVIEYTVICHALLKIYCV